MCALVIAQMRVIRARIVCGINPSDFSQLPLFGRHTSKDRFVLVRKSKEHLQALGFTTENESMELMSMENGIRLASDLVESEDWKTSIQDEFHAKAAGLSSDEQLLFKCIVSEDLETLRDVLDRNVDVDVCHPVHGGRPLHVASGLGSIDAVQCLIRANAQVNARARNGATPLHWAAGAGNLKVAKLLLDAGADARIKTFTWNTNIGGKGSGQTPVHWAAESGFSNVIHVIAQYDPVAVVLVDERKESPKTLAVQNHQDHAIDTIEKITNDEYFVVELIDEHSVEKTVKK